MIQKITNIDTRKNLNSCGLSLAANIIDGEMYQKVTPFHSIR